MLDRAAAAASEMGARRFSASFPGVQPFDNPALASAASAGTEPRADAVARHREGQKDRFAVSLANAVALGAQPFDRKLDEPVRASLIPVKRPRHHKRRSIPSRGLVEHRRCS